MKRTNVKKALVVLAVASLAAGMSSNAFAGIDACIEFYKQAVLPTAATLPAYTGSACTADRGTVGTLHGAIGLIVPYEMTGTLQLDLGATGGIAGSETLTIVYIPTSAIPPGSYITMDLGTAGTAQWTVDNANLWLVASDGTNLTNAATSIGNTNTNEIKFLTGGVEIPGGTRLVISAAGASINPPTIVLTNTGCTAPQAGVALTVPKAQTAQLVDIPGATTNVSYKLVDNSARQFNFYLATINDPTQAQVDVSPSILKKSFLPGAVAASLDTTATQVFYTATVENTGLAAGFDIIIANTASNAIFTFTSVNSGNTLKNITSNMSVIVSENTAPGAVTAVTPVTGGGVADFVTVAGPPPTTNTATVTVPGEYIFKAGNVGFPTSAASATKNDIFYALTTDESVAMLSNYLVNARLALTFDNVQFIQTCDATTKAFNIGVNGTIFRVPYLLHDIGMNGALGTASSFVRISNNEGLGNDAAAITADFFVEGTGFKCDSVVLNPAVNPKSSVVISDVQMLNAISSVTSDGSQAGDDNAAACTAVANQLTTDNAGKGRFSAIFTVAAPRDSVHAVAVQKAVGGVGTGDRVVPVLFETAIASTWQQ